MLTHKSFGAMLKHAMKKLIWITPIAALSLVLSIYLGAAVVHHTQQQQIQAEATRVANEKPVWVQINDVRNAHGLPPLKENVYLDKSASLKAEDMVEKHYRTHVSPNGTQPWFWFHEADVNYFNAAENLAECAQDTDADVTAWVHSPEHLANILGPYTDFGSATVIDPTDGCRISVNHFASF